MTRRTRNGIVIAWLAIQLALPLRGFLRDKFDTAGRFTWNMYAHDYRCGVSYLAVEPGRPIEQIDHRAYFRRPDRAIDAFHRDTLPRFHAHVCAERKEAGRGGILRGRVECTLNGSPRRPLIVVNGDVCSAPNYGVAAE